MFLRFMSVSSIVGFLNKAVIRLRELARLKERQAEEVSEAIGVLVVKRDGLYEECDRAQRVANRIEELID